MKKTMENKKAYYGKPLVALCVKLLTAAKAEKAIEAWV